MYKRGPSEQGAGMVEGGRGTSGGVWSRGRNEGRRKCVSKEAGRESRSRARYESMRSSCGAADIRSLIRARRTRLRASRYGTGTLKQRPGQTDPTFTGVSGSVH
jgi:hypothetical protein